jgi:5-formyltetrahydrofolate cyclo-ligase
VKAWRKQMRSKLLKERTSLAADLHLRDSNRVLHRLMEVLDPLRIKLIGLYWPIQGEIDVLPIVERFLAAGGRAALPVIVARNSPLEFRRWKPGDAMADGVYNISYPSEGEVVMPDVLLVPLVGFDAACYRLGYGGGYYDRSLASMSKRAIAIGVGFSGGRLETIHSQSFDIPMDYILTEDATVQGTP